ncbi:MAG: inositol monophosphatase family protein [Bacillota bacterium]
MNPSFDKHKRYLQIAQEAAREAGKTVLNWQKNISISEKAANNLVTEADLAAQEIITGIIQEHFPEHSIIAEEGDLRAKSNASNLWIIDPLDGTNNFAHTIPHFCISIAYASKGQVMAGIVYDPLRNEVFSAIRGQGTFLNEAPIRVSETRSLSEAIVATGFYYERCEIMRKTLNSIEQLFEANVHGIRRYGSAALDLCWVACGRFDAYFEYKISTWDFAAGMLILEEAGGKCSDHRGEVLGLNSTGIAVSNGKIHEEFLNIVGWGDFPTDSLD